MMTSIVDLENRSLIREIPCGKYFEAWEQCYRMTDHVDAKNKWLAMHMDTGMLEGFDPWQEVYPLAPKEEDIEFVRD